MLHMIVIFERLLPKKVSVFIGNWSPRYDLENTCNHKSELHSYRPACSTLIDKNNASMQMYNRRRKHSYIFIPNIIFILIVARQFLIGFLITFEPYYFLAIDANALILLSLWTSIVNP